MALYGHYYGNDPADVESMMRNPSATNNRIGHEHTLRAYSWTVALQWLLHGGSWMQTLPVWFCIFGALLLVDRATSGAEGILHRIYKYLLRLAYGAPLWGSRDDQATDASAPIRSAWFQGILRLCLQPGLRVNLRAVLVAIWRKLRAVWRSWTKSTLSSRAVTPTTAANQTSANGPAHSVDTNPAKSKAGPASSWWTWWCSEDGVCTKIDDPQGLEMGSTTVLKASSKDLEQRTDIPPTSALRLIHDYSGVRAGTMQAPVSFFVSIPGVTETEQRQQQSLLKRNNLYAPLYARIDSLLGYTDSHGTTTSLSAPRHAVFAALLGTPTPTENTIDDGHLNAAQIRELKERNANGAKPTGIVSSLLSSMNKVPRIRGMTRARSVSHPGTDSNDEDAVHLLRECSTIAHLLTASRTYDDICTHLRPFDAVFSRGASVVSDFITTVQGVVRENCRLFSHVGYLINTDVYAVEGMVPGEWYVVESVYSGLANYDSTLNVANQSFSGGQIRSLRAQLAAPENRDAFYFIAFLNDAARQKIQHLHADRIEHVVSMYLGVGYPMNPFNFIAGFFEGTAHSVSDSTGVSGNVEWNGRTHEPATQAHANALRAHETWVRGDARDSMRALGSRPESEMFCSELVCRTYQQLGVVNALQTDFRYVYPVDFFDSRVMDPIFDRIVPIAYVQPSHGRPIQSNGTPVPVE